MAGIYHGHLLEFPQIRVDCFLPAPVDKNKLWQLPCIPSSSSSPITYQAAPPAQLFLLTHTHADHLMGLSSDFTGKILCSPDTKRMLLKLETEGERGLVESGHREIVTKRFGGLAPRMMGGKLVDQIVTVPIGESQDFVLGYDKDGKEQRVRITLLDANHCPGSTMFLITSETKSVLHTGDFRADALFVQTLRREPALQAYLAPPRSRQTTEQVGGGRKVLDRIYLDTAAMIGTQDMPDREPVLQELVENMAMYPSDTIFFLNVWCFGWECVIKEVARYFNEKVHVDRYKREIYAAVRSDPFLLDCTTDDPSFRRFHACERFAKCNSCRKYEKGFSGPVYNLDKRIVHVNMVEEKQAGWDLKKGAFVKTLIKASKGIGEWPTDIDTPIARHSTLPELQAFVCLFRPHTITPNSVASHAKGLDYVQLPELFEDHLSSGGKDVVIRERDLYLTRTYEKHYLVGLRELQRRGEEVRPQLSRVEMEENPVPRRDYLPERGVGKRPGRAQAQCGGQRTVSSRSATAKDQGARASNLPYARPVEIFNKIMDEARAPWLKVESAKARKSKEEELRGAATGYETDASQERMRYRERYECEMNSPISEAWRMLPEVAPECILARIQEQSPQQMRVVVIEREEPMEAVKIEEMPMAHAEMEEEEAWMWGHAKREMEILLAKAGYQKKGMDAAGWPAAEPTVTPWDWTSDLAVPSADKPGPIRVKVEPESQLPPTTTPSTNLRASSSSIPLTIQPKIESVSSPTTRLQFTSQSSSSPVSARSHCQALTASRASSSGKPHKTVKCESCSSQSQSRKLGRHSMSGEDRERIKKQLTRDGGGPGLSLRRGLSVRKEVGRL